MTQAWVACLVSQTFMRMGAPQAHGVFPRSLSPQALRGERESGTPLARWIPALARYAARDLIGGGMTSEYLQRILDSRPWRAELFPDQWFQPDASGCSGGNPACDRYF